VKLPENLKQVADARAPEVLFVPGGFFFSRIVALPEEIERDEWESFAELTLEECSPFPLEQLAWGFMVDGERREMCLFAACRPRIGQAALDSWDEAEHVFPAFLPLLLAFPQPPPKLVWHSEDEAMLLEFDEGARFPKRIRHRPRRRPEPVDEDEECEPEDDGVLEALLAENRMDSETTPVYVLHETKVSDDRQVSFRLRENREDAEPLPPVSPADDEASWWADLRPPEFIASEKRSRALQGKLWIGMQAAGWAAIGLLALFVSTIVGDVFVERRQEKILAQAPQVKSVEDNINFVSELKQFSERPLRPYEVLGETNEFRPAKEIYYRAAAVDADRGVTIQGYADRVNQVNAFSDKLVQSGKFALREDPKFRLRGNQTEFTLRLDFIAPRDPDGEPLAMNQNTEASR